MSMRPRIVEKGASLDDYYAVLRMLVRRATLLDRVRAWRLKGHWLNHARRELLIHPPLYNTL